MEKDNRPFPIQGGFKWYDQRYHKQSHIPWWLAEEAYKIYKKNYCNDQSLERLAERGGFGRSELIMLLSEINWGEWKDNESKTPLS